MLDYTDTVIIDYGLYFESMICGRSNTSELYNIEFSSHIETVKCIFRGGNFSFIEHNSPYFLPITIENKEQPSSTQ